MADQRNTTTMIVQRTTPPKCLSPLRGFGSLVAPDPTDKSVGYYRVSLRDKDTIVGDLREIVALIEQEEGVET